MGACGGRGGWSAPWSEASDRLSQCSAAVKVKGAAGIRAGPTQASPADVLANPAMAVVGDERPPAEA